MGNSISFGLLVPTSHILQEYSRQKKKTKRFSSPKKRKALQPMSSKFENYQKAPNCTSCIRAHNLQLTQTTL